MNWSILQSGIGIDIQAGTFEAVCVKRQWKRLSVAGRLEIPQYEQIGAQECGRLYREFLRKNGLRVPWTVVALPRSAVMLRWLALPRAVEKDLAQAVQYQLDSLHPFEEGSVYWDFASSMASQNESVRAGAVPERMEVPVAIAEQKYVEKIAAWFQDAGIGVSQFTVTTAALLAALVPRLGLVPAMASGARGTFFVLTAGPESYELTAYAPGVACISKVIPIASGLPESDQAIIPMIRRELDLARSELRLENEDRPPLVFCGEDSRGIAPALAEELPFEVVPVEHFYPSLRVEPSVELGNFRLGEQIVAFTAALTAADHKLPFSLNLLPREKRVYQSPLAYVPAYGLLAIVFALLVALGLRGSFQDWQYSKYLDRQIQALQPQLQAVEAAQSQSHKASERMALLQSVRNAAIPPLEILNELTGLLPGDIWLQSLQFDGDTLAIAGSAKSSVQLLQTLSGSSYFENPQFISPMVRTQDGTEIFRIAVKLRKAK